MQKSFLLSVFAIALLLASGCRTGEKNASEPARQNVMAGGAVHLQLKPGKTIQIVLDGNATTGYTWHFANENPAVVSVKEGKYLPTNPDLCGAPGKFTWEIRALAPGKAKLIYRYYRSWEGFDPKQDREQIYVINVPEN